MCKHLLFGDIFCYGGHFSSKGHTTIPEKIHFTHENYLRHRENRSPKRRRAKASGPPCLSGSVGGCGGVDMCVGQHLEAELCSRERFNAWRWEAALSKWKGCVPIESKTGSLQRSERGGKEVKRNGSLPFHSSRRNTRGRITCKRVREESRGNMFFTNLS